jgi:YesN/AraC family two-component response regulator
VRITNAKDYLANTSLSIADISNNVGYADPMYFSRLFKKYTGMTLSEYRKKHKTSKDSYMMSNN